MNAKRFAGICLGIFCFAVAGHFAAEQIAVQRWRAQLPEESSKQELATSALNESGFASKAPPSKARRDPGKRTRCAALEIQEAGEVVFRAQCPVGKTRCPWVSLGEDELRVSGGYLPAQSFPIGPDTRLSCEEIQEDGSLVGRVLLPKISAPDAGDLGRSPLL